MEVLLYTLPHGLWFLFKPQLNFTISTKLKCTIYKNLNFNYLKVFLNFTISLLNSFFQMHARADVEKSADAMLANGMENKNQNQMALALQVI